MADKNLYGIVAAFKDPGSLLKAAEKIRDAGYKKFDTHSPFPIHGMDKAMGLRESVLGLIVFAVGTCGAIGGFTLQAWASKYGYALTISGKEFMSIPAFVPITFEVMVLSSAFAAVFGMFGLNLLPQFYHALFKSKTFTTFSSDGFVVSIEAQDPRFDKDKTQAFLKEIGGENIEVIEED